MSAGSESMKERPILFSGEMVRAILDGRKTQTRRIVKPQPEYRENSSVPGTFGTFTKGGWNLDHPACSPTDPAKECPYGVSGDRLWVRETFNRCGCQGCEDAWPKQGPAAHGVTYKQGYGGHSGLSWRPSIFMPRWASRLTLEVTKVRVERLHDISIDDVLAEGIEAVADGAHAGQYAREETGHRYAMLWNKINGKDSWNANHWVWVIEFKKL